MLPFSVETFQDTPDHRQELAAFLQETWPAQTESQTWHKRLSYWWDANPWASPTSHRGWVAHDHDRLVGYGGFIPFAYAWAGQPLPALMASSFHVDHDHALAAMTMFRKQRKVQETTPIVHATPLPRIQQTLMKMGSQAETQVTRRVFLMGALRHLRHLHGGRWWPRLDDSLHLITQPKEATSLARPYRREDRLEKWNTLESLQWWCQSPMREHRFIGVADRAGVLTSFLLLTPRKLRRFAAWDVVEAFTAREDNSELHAVAGALVRDPDLLPGRKRLLTAAAFSCDTSWENTPSIISRVQRVGHYFLLPEPLRHAPKLTVMAEGDIGL